MRCAISFVIESLWVFSDVVVLVCAECSDHSISLNYVQGTGQRIAEGLCDVESDYRGNGKSLYESKEKLVVIVLGGCGQIVSLHLSYARG